MEQIPSWWANICPVCQEVTRLLRNPKFQSRVHDSQPSVPKLIHVNPADTFKHDFFPFRFNIILHLCLGLPNGHFPSGLQMSKALSPDVIICRFQFIPYIKFVDCEMPSQKTYVWLLWLNQRCLYQSTINCAIVTSVGVLWGCRDVNKGCFPIEEAWGWARTETEEGEGKQSD
jgi:hypothetical protein